MIHPKHVLLLAACALGVSCGDPFEPILTPIPEPREVTLVDFTAGDLVDPGAYDMFSGSAVRTDQTFQWDFVFVIDEEDGSTLVPRQTILGETSTAGLQLTEGPFDALESAPEGGYTMDAPVPVEPGDVLFAVSRRNLQFQVRCRVFGKLEVLSIEGNPASLELRTVVNPNCERRELIEEEDED